MRRNLEKLELPVYSVKGHKEIINAIDGVGGLGIGEGAPELVTAGRDGRQLYTLHSHDPCQPCCSTVICPLCLYIVTKNSDATFFNCVHL